MKLYLVHGLLLVCSILASSVALGDIDKAVERHVSKEIPSFQPYEPNYAIWQWTDDDNDALEAHYSFKYLMTRTDCTEESLNALESASDCADKFHRRKEVYFKFTGEFDFYFGTRESGPVINRISNPGLHFRKYLQPAEDPGFVNPVYWDLGVQHFSNGQVVDAELRRDGRFRSEFFYDIDPFSPYFDTISRGVDFLSLESRFRIGPGSDEFDSITARCTGNAGCYDLWVRVLPWYLNDDNPVTWGPDAGIRRNVADFERMRVVLSHYRTIGAINQRGFGIEDTELSVTWKVGDEGFDTDSFEIGLLMRLQLGRQFRIPLYIQYHNGPLNNLSNYSYDQDSIGIGLRFY